MFKAGLKNSTQTAKQYTKKGVYGVSKNELSPGGTLTSEISKTKIGPSLGRYILVQTRVRIRKGGSRGEISVLAQNGCHWGGKGRSYY